MSEDTLDTGIGESSEATVNQAQLDHVRGKMIELQEALDAQVPGFANILKEIHDVLRADPEVVTILEPEEISVIVKGLEKHANIIVTPAKAKKAGSKKFAVPKDISAGDL